jgi:hypothetical protein
MSWRTSKRRRPCKTNRHQTLRRSSRLQVEHLETRLAPANIPVLSAHYDPLISGANTQETDLTPTSVNATNFGRLFNYAVDGYTYAQPLYVPKGMYDGVHNVVFAATEHDSVYAFDADGGGQLWKRSFIDPANGITSVPQPDVISGDIVPEIGITGTPAIDPATKTMYVVPKTKEVVNGVAHYVQRLHAIDITTGATTAMVTIGDTTGSNNNTTNISVLGGGDGSVNGVLSFNALKENQRPALALINGLVYVTWASHGDNGPYHGWVVGYNESNIGAGPAQILNTSPNGSASGIWMSGGGLAFDAQNNIYMATGNGFGTGFAPTPVNLVGTSGGGLGYQWIGQSVAVTFRAFDHSSTGLATNGNFTGPNFDLGGSTGIDFNAGAQSNPRHVFQATLSYSGTTLTETIKDLTTNSTPVTETYNVNIPQIVGGSTAWVGFTGGTGGLNAQQDIQSWTYSVGGTTVIDHSAGFASNSDLQANGNSSFTSGVARITPAANGQAGSVFAKNQVNATNFSTTFNFQMSAGSNPIADGLTFTIQNAAQGNFSESVLKLSSTGQLSVADYFTPTDWKTLDNNDADLGSGGTMLLPDSVGSQAHPHLIIETGKTGRMYLMDRDNLGKNNTPGQDLNLQTVTIGGPGVWGNPAFFQDGPNTGLIYYWGTSVPAQAFRITNGVIDPNPVTKTNFSIGFPGAQVSISANGTDPNSAIMWASRVDNFGQNGPAELMAFKAENLSQQLYSSNGTGLRDHFGNSVKFVFPIVSNGKVFAGSNGFLSVFGLFPAVTSAPNSPSNLSGTAVQGGTQIQLTWTNPTTGQPATGIKIFRSIDGVTYTLVNTVARDVNTYTDTGLTPATLFHYRVVATNQAGDSSPSNTLDIRTRISAPVLQVADICVGAITLRWTATANDHYVLERGDANGANFTVIASSLPASQTTFTDTGLANGTYTYRVTGFSVFPEGNDSAISNVAKATIGPINIDHGAPNGNPGFLDHSDMQASGSAFFSTDEHLLRLTDNFSQAGSAFTVQQVGIRGFTTSFQFRLHEGTQPNPADGLTFTLQPNSPGALGFGGGALGYQGIGKSVAIKFDIWNNEGETDNSTGLFFNGDFPGLPHATGEVNIPLAANNVNLRSQSTKTITLTYDGVAHKLTEKIHDPTPGQINNGDFTTTYDVDIAAKLGVDTSFAGFTGGTGGAFVLEDVLNWQYTEQEGNLPPRAPTNLRVTQVDRHDHNRSDITIAWNCNNAYTAQGFVVEESPNGTSWSQIDQVGAGTQTDTFEKLGGGVYYYRVRSINGIGTSQPSNVFSVDIAGGDHPFDMNFPNFNNHSFVTANGTATFSGFVYKLDDGSSEENFNNSQGVETEDNWVANSFQIAAGTETLTSISFLLSGNYTNRPITALIYTGTSLTDPHAGSGLTLVSETDTAFSGTNGTFVTIPLAKPVTLPVGQVYWAALLMRGVPGNQFPFNEDRDKPLGRSWFDVGPTQGGAYDVNNTSNARVFGATDHPVVPGGVQDPGNLMLRVNATGSAAPLVARLTDGGFGEAGDVFTNNAISFNNFTTSFTYKESPQVGAADGFTFIMQTDTRGANAVGGAGGGLGYTGIANSIAIKFDIWNSGSHRSSTGIYFDGEPPDSIAGRARSIYMDTDPKNVIDFNSGHVFKIDLAYSSTAKVLTETVTDTVTNAKFTTSYNVDIAAHLMSNVGYVGFGGGTGGETSVQDILTWTYHSAGKHDKNDIATGGGDQTAGQAPGGSDSALLVELPSSSGSFSTDTAQPLTGPAASSVPDSSGVLAGTGSSAPAAELISDVARVPLAGAPQGEGALDQLFSLQDLEVF